jgi:tetratricopeptide (TPR) repeat protein
MGRGQLEEAERLYNEILDEDGEVLIAYERLGAIYMLQGRYQEAAQTLSYAVPLRPDWYDLYVKLAQAQIALGELDRAEATLRGSLQLTAPNADTHCLLGYISERRLILPDALQQYRECNRLEPDSPEPLISLARVRTRMGDTAAATARVREALALDAGAVGAHYILGQIAAAAGQPQRAIDEYLAEIDNDPDNVDAHFGLAMLYGDADRRAEERRHLEAILSVQPQHPLAALFLADLLLQSGQELERAVDLVTAAVQEPLERQDLAAGYFILSNLHERLGNVALAREYLQRAQNLRER